MCVLLATQTCKVWRYMLSRICRIFGHHFKCSVDTLILRATYKFHSHIVDIEQPVEHEVHTQRHVDKLVVGPRGRLVHGGHGVDHLHDVHQLVVLTLQPLTFKFLHRHRQVNQIHWGREKLESIKLIKLNVLYKSFKVHKTLKLCIS